MRGQNGNYGKYNPSTYTKLSCFLPWVAHQYGLEYKVNGQAERECIEGQGDPRDGENACRISKSQLLNPIAGEVECIFPVHHGGKRYDQCDIFDESGFVYPVF